MAKSKLNANLSTIGNYPKKNPVKCAIVALFLMLALIGLIISKGVKINYSLSDYLNEETETSIALEIMSDEFGMTGNVQVMLTGIDKDTANAVKADLSAIEGVLNVSFDAYNPSNYKEDTKSALFTILINGEDHSDTAKAVMEEIKTTLSDKYGTVELGGSTVEYNALREITSGEMGLIVVLSVAMAAVLLLITASSWIEPLILLGCSGIAIAINMGLNVFLGEISYITKSVSSILQLALSVDYSIVLLHAYRDVKKTQSDNTEAMRSAVKAVLNPVSASALTTIAGLVALLFMSFTIGFDIGIVLIKGIVVSAITAMVFLPVVVLMLDGLIKKTAKRPFVPRGEFFSNFAAKFGKFVAPIAAVLIISGAVLQSLNGYGFTDSIGSNKNIESTFGRSDTVVIVYPNSINASGLQGEYEDYRKEMLLKEAMDKYTNEKGENPVSSYTAYATTVREIYDLDKAIRVLGLPKNDVKMLFAMYNIYSDSSSLQLTPYEFIRYTNALINSGDPDVSSLVDDGTKKTIALLNSVADLSTTSYTATGLLEKLNSISAESGISEFAIKQMYGLYFYDQIAASDKTINTHALCTYLSSNISNIQLGNITISPNLLDFAFKQIKDNSSPSESLTYTQFFDQKIGSIGNIGDRITPELTQQLYIMYLINADVSVGDKKLSECTINGKEFVDILSFPHRCGNYINFVLLVLYL
jgi:predicted RND superfamily exporter protein